MNGPKPQPPTKALLAILVAVSYLAIVIASFGFLSLALGVDVVSDPSVGPIVGPVSVAAAWVVTTLSLVRMPRRGFPVLRAVATAASVYLVMLAVAVIGGFSLVVEQAVSPFVGIASALAAACTVALWAFDRATLGD